MCSDGDWAVFLFLIPLNKGDLYKRGEKTIIACSAITENIPKKFSVAMYNSNFVSVPDNVALFHCDQRLIGCLPEQTPQKFESDMHRYTLNWTRV